MKRRLSNGLFISFEGGEGSGKTTQIKLLSKALEEKGYGVITTREPGGTPEGEAIRDVLVQRNGGKWLPMAEVLLLYAARLMHIERIIKPAIADGFVVISDRFADSTLAYQGYGHGLPSEGIKAVEALTIGNFKPELTFILDIDPKTGLERSNKRLTKTESSEQTEDRFERLDIKFHERLHQGFLNIAKTEPARCRVIDARQDIEAISQKIEKSVMLALSKKTVIEDFGAALPSSPNKK